MQEAGALFFKAEKFHVDALLVPAEGVADLLCGFTAALLLPACAQSDGHAAQKDIAQSDRRLMRYRLCRFRYEMAAMWADRLAQALV